MIERAGAGMAQAQVWRGYGAGAGMARAQVWCFGATRPIPGHAI